MRFIATIKWWNRETLKIAKGLRALIKQGATKNELDVARYEQLGLSCMRYAKELEEGWKEEREAEKVG